MKSVKSFTLIEIIVAMTLGVLVILLAITVFTFFSQQFHQAMKKYDAENEVLHAYFLLKENFAKANLIVYENGDLNFHYTDGENNLLYFQDNELLFKRKNYIDTIHVTIENLNIVTFKNKPIVRFVEFEINNQILSVPCSFFKDYPKELLIKEDYGN